MSNRRKLPQEIPPGVRATAKAAKCSDCNGRAQARFREGAWSIKFWHSQGCPAFTGTTRGLHADAAASVERGAKASGSELTYEIVSDETGMITGSGLVTAGGGLT